MKRINLSSIGLYLTIGGSILIDIWGYVLWEQTLIAWWIPILVAAVIGLAATAGCAKWWKIMNFGIDSEQAAGWLQVILISSLCYFGFLATNYYTADELESVTRQALIVKKTEQTRYHSSRSHRRHNPYKVYYAYLEFEDGTTKRLSVSKQKYHTLRSGSKTEIKLMRGCFTSVSSPA